MAGKISLAINLLLVIAVIYLFGRQPASTVEEPASTALVDDSTQVKEYPSIAWVSNDSLQKNYKLVISIEKELEKFSNEITTLETRFQNLNKEVALIEQNFTANVNNGIYQSEAAYQQALISAGEKAENKGKEMNNIKTKLDSRYKAYQDKSLELNDSLLTQINTYIKSYCEGKPIDLILLYSENGNGLYANDKLNLTSEIIDGLNEQYDSAVINSEK